MGKMCPVGKCNPKYKLDDAEIRNEFWAVHVDSAFVKTEELVRKRKNCIILGNAEGTKIACPSTFNKEISAQNDIVQQEMENSYAYMHDGLNKAISKGANAERLAKNKETLVQNEIARQGSQKTTIDMNKESATPINKSMEARNVSRTHKKQRGRTSCWVDGSSIMVGTKVLLKSLKNPNKDVALATFISSDPKYKLWVDALGNEFWAVQVDAPLATSEQLVRPFKGYKIIGHAAGTDIAWPLTIIDKING